MIDTYFSASMAANLGDGKTRIANVVVCFFLLSMHMIAGLGTNANYGIEVTSTEKLEIQKLLKKLNKPAVKSIESPDGDIIDCVSILNQPAFDHPKLKNHKIKMRPSFLLDENKRTTLENGKMSSKSNPIVQPWHQIGRCPRGTIPIRRTREEDILRASSIQQFGKKNHKSFLPSPSYVPGHGDHEYAYTYIKADKFYGAKATMSVWQPTVQQKDEASISKIWVMALDGRYVDNSIEAGWQVNPQLYGDNEVRLFTSWTIDSYGATGCYDLLCSGFVQLDSQIALGSRLTQLSVYGDPNSQHNVTLTIQKDVKKGDWWLTFGDNQVVGYWPSSLFTTLSDGATIIQMGGEVVHSTSDGTHTETQMGSGHFPSEGFGKAAFFKDIKYFNDQNKLVTIGYLSSQISSPNCYDMQLDHTDDQGNFFFYGGPGRNPNCTY